jgi:hypothetical protein
VESCFARVFQNSKTPKLLQKPVIQECLCNRKDQLPVLPILLN